MQCSGFQHDEDGGIVVETSTVKFWWVVGIEKAWNDNHKTHRVTLQWCNIIKLQGQLL